MKKLEEIDFHALRRWDIVHSWGGGLTYRFFHVDDRNVYKIWSKKYSVHNLHIVGDRYELYSGKGRDEIVLLSCGLVSPENCPALIDTITDEEGICRGYVSLLGESIQDWDQVPTQFVEELFARSVQTGYVHSDFKLGNLIFVDGRVSFIDVDSPPAKLADLNLEFQKTHGMLRAGMNEIYKELILSHLEFESRMR